jgi:hypothetical protein
MAVDIQRRVCSIHTGEFGSKYSMYSACNPYAVDPPVIVDGNGQFYGRLTLNRYHPQATNNSTLLGWLAAVCESPDDSALCTQGGPR